MASFHSPFAQALRNPAHRSLASAYTQVRAETGVSGADAHQLVRMLFDGLHDALQEALGAMQRGDVGVKCLALSRAARIVDEGLKAGLNLESGLDVAQNLLTLYEYLSVQITKANLRNDPALVEHAVALVQPVRQAWRQIAPTGQAVN